MQGRRHIQRFVVIVGTRNRDKARRRVRANQLKKLGEPGASEAADYIPPLDADVAGVLPGSRESLDLRQTVLSGFLNFPTHAQRPVFENHPWIINVVIIERKFLKWSHRRVSKGWRQVAGAKQFAGSPIAEAESLVQKRLSQSGNGKGSHGHDRRQLERPRPVHLRKSSLAELWADVVCVYELWVYQLRIAACRIRAFRINVIRVAVLRIHSPPVHQTPDHGIRPRRESFAQDLPFGHRIIIRSLSPRWSQSFAGLSTAFRGILSGSVPPPKEQSQIPACLIQVV